MKSCMDITIFIIVGFYLTHASSSTTFLVSELERSQTQLHTKQNSVWKNVLSKGKIPGLETYGYLLKHLGPLLIPHQAPLIPKGVLSFGDLRKDGWSGTPSHRLVFWVAFHQEVQMPDLQAVRQPHRKSVWSYFLVGKVPEFRALKFLFCFYADVTLLSQC